jgi:short-subunit dehydrogenase
MRSYFVESAFDNHLTLMNVNVHGPFRHMQLLLPHMLTNRCGQIVGITSQAAKLSTAFRSSYAASKAAFIGIMDSLRSELKPYGVRVCNIMPGYIRTNISKNAFGAEAGKKFGKVDSNIEEGMAADQFAREAVAAAYNNENEVSIGRLWWPALGIALRNVCPDLVFHLLYKNAKNQEQALLNAKDE